MSRVFPIELENPGDKKGPKSWFANCNPGNGEFFSPTATPQSKISRPFIILYNEHQQNVRFVVKFYKTLIRLVKPGIM
jgi:hypothetical protein